MGLKKHSTLFRLLVTLVIIYGCEVWESSTSHMYWRQIDKIQKYMITKNHKVKSSAVPYALLLSEAWASPIEAIVVVRVIGYF